MKTVLFIDKADEEVWSSFLRYDFVLDEYGEAGAFDVCDWHPDGMSVSAAVPELADIVGDEESWRAIIVCDLRKEMVDPETDRHFDNPYDFPENYDVPAGEPLRESQRPIVRLTQMLGGLPEKSVIEWPDFAKSSREAADAFGRPDDVILADEAISLNEFEVLLPQSDERYDLLKRYRLGVARPQELLCITPRDIDSDLAQERRSDFEEERQLRESREIELIEKANWKGLEGLTDEERAELEVEVPLGFWQRNSYPSSARFIVCDRLAAATPDEHAPDAPELPKPQTGGVASATKRDPWFHFWLSVLALVVADVPSSYLRPYKVHEIHVDLDEEQLDSVFSRRYTEWSAVRRRIALELEGEELKLATSDLFMNEVPDCTTSIAVSFGSVDESGLHADPNEVGFIKDVPENDRSVWARQRASILDEFRSLLRAPARGLSMAAARFRMSNTLDPSVLEYCVLNGYQRAELEDEVRAMEYDLARGVGLQSFDIASHRSSIDDASDVIVESIARRPSKSQAIFAAIAACAALFIGLVPYCFGIMGGAASNASAWLVTVACCLVLLATVAVTLLRMRNNVRDSYRSFNGVISRLLANLHSDANRLGARLSAYATFKKKQEILYRQKRRGALTERAKGLDQQDALLRTRTDDILRIAPNATINPDLYNGILRGGWDRALNLLETPSFFSVCDAWRVERTLNGGTASQMAVKMPYSFIVNMGLEPIDVC